MAQGERSRRAAVIVGLLVVLALVVTGVTWLTRSSAQAQIPTDFILTVSDGSLVSPAGGTSDITVGIEPADSAIAAIGVTVTYDQTALIAESCVALIGLGACSTDAPGEVVLQTVDPDGWVEPTELFRITFAPLAIEDSVPLNAIVNQAYDANGTLIAGQVDDGTIDLQIQGDVNCDGRLNIADALALAQYSVRARVEGACPIDLASEIDLRTADVTGDGTVNLADALKVAQCSVGARDCQE